LIKISFGKDRGDLNFTLLKIQLVMLQTLSF
jgi:hypothetical protein